MFSDHCKPLKLLSVSLQRGKHWTAVPWGWLPASDQQEGPRHVWDHKVRIQKLQFLFDEPMLFIVLGGVCFKEGMKIPDLLKRKLLSLVLLYI